MAPPPAGTENKQDPGSSSGDEHGTFIWTGRLSTGWDVSPLEGAGWIMATLLLPYLIWKGGLPLAVVLLAVPASALAFLLIYRYPLLGLHLVWLAGFTGTGIKRHLNIPAGLSVDFLLLALLVVMVVRNLYDRDLSLLRHPVSLLVLIWILYCFLQLLNPEAVSAVAWFYAVRGLGLYMLLCFLVPLVIRKKGHLYGIVLHWMVAAGLLALWGIKQIWIGVTAGEARWLAVPGNASTHILFGKLRAFSLLSDCGQFGCFMAYTSFVAAWLALLPLRLYLRLGLALVSCLCFYGLMLSGTRSAILAVPIALFAALLMSRRWKVILPGMILGLAFVGVLRYTTIGQSNYNIRRMRDAFTPLDDPSFQVRLENQKRLIPYLKTRPFGGGIGSAGYWGARFSPGTFLANLALDSWYVKLAAETGPIGLFYYLAMMLYTLWVGFRVYPRVRDPCLKQVILALFSAFSAVLVVSYSNQYMGQVPTGIIIYTTMAVFIIAPRLDSGDSERRAGLVPPHQRDGAAGSTGAISRWRMARRNGRDISGKEQCPRREGPGT